MEVYGYVEGNVAADTLLIHQSGQCYGTVKTESAEIRGTLQGDVVVKHLISIRDTGSVSGNVQYGALAMEPGGNLTAEVRNVPPAVAGDLDVTVARGQSVRITLEDLHAVDPDDEAKDLIFTVSNARNGFVALSARRAGRPPSSRRPIWRLARSASSTTARRRRLRASTSWSPTTPGPPPERRKP